MPVRNEPSHRAEQVNQLLFGEKAEVLEVDNKDWAKIRGIWDGYEGWCKISQLTIITKKEFWKETKHIAASNNDKLIFEESMLWLPLGSELYGLKSGKITPGKTAGQYKGKKQVIKSLPLNPETIAKNAMQYLNVPYQWGGRSIAGIDCSGLTQMAYKLCGKNILRDAEQQAMEGELVDFLQHAICGDLAFFDNADGKITHVGILLDNTTIIHAADSCGHVTIDPIDQAGIISSKLRMRTHNLRFIKRYITT